MHFDSRPQPGHIAVPTHIVGAEEDDDVVVEPDASGGDDNQPSGEERDDLELLGGADLEGEQGAEGDGEDDEVKDEVERAGGDHVDSLVEAGALGTGDENFPVVWEGAKMC